MKFIKPKAISKTISLDSVIATFPIYIRISFGFMHTKITNNSRNSKFGLTERSVYHFPSDIKSRTVTKVVTVSNTTIRDIKKFIRKQGKTESKATSLFRASSRLRVPNS